MVEHYAHGHERMDYKNDVVFGHLGKNSNKLFDFGCDPWDQNFRKFRYKIEWNRKFLKTRFENFGQRLEVVLKFWKIGILGKSRSFRHTKISKTQTGIFGGMDRALQLRTKDLKSCHARPILH